MLFPARLNNRWGLRHKTHGWIFEPEFDHVQKPINGLVAVLVDGKWGLMDLKQHWVCKPMFDEIGDITAGIMATKLDGSWGLSGLDGRTIVRHEHFWLGAPAQGGLVDAHRDVGLHVFYDHLGSPVTEFKAYSLSYYGNRHFIILGDWLDGDEVDADGASLFEMRYVSIDGTTTIDEVFRHAFPFRCGIAQVRSDSDWACIDCFGNRVIDGTVHSGYKPTPGVSFAEGLLALHGENTVRCVDLLGKIVWERELNYSMEYAEGLSVAETLDYKVGWIDRSGKFVIEPRYEMATSFQNGIAFAFDETEEVYLFSDGEVLWRQPVD